MPQDFSVQMLFLQSEAAIPKTRLADILFAYSLCYAAGQFLMGSLADRFGPRIVLGLGLIVAAASDIAMAASPPYAILLALSMMNGLAQSTGWPGLLKLMAAWFAPSERGVVMGWWCTNYVLRGFLATLFAAWTVSFGDWRRGFILHALPLLAIAAIFLLVARDRAGAVSTTTQSRRVERLQILRQPAAWASAVTAFLIKVTRYSFLYWLPLYLTEELHYKPGQAGYLSSVYELAGIAGALTAGYTSDRLAHSRRGRARERRRLARATRLAVSCGGGGHTLGMGRALSGVRRCRSARRSDHGTLLELPPGRRIRRCAGGRSTRGRHAMIAPAAVRRAGAARVRQMQRPR